VIGVGVDIVAVARIAALLDRHGTRFVNRCFRAEEAAFCATRGPQSAGAFAARWAAKEAFLKALGRPTTGIHAPDIEVIKGAAGQPGLRLHATAAAALVAVGGRRVHLSLSHEREQAVAVVVVE